MKNQRMVYTYPLLDEMVNQYRESHNLTSWSMAAMELLMRGIQSWIDTGESQMAWGMNEEERAALEMEYQTWLESHFLSTDSDLNDKEKDQFAFYRFIIEKMSPKRGGKRLGQGRPKGSKNKLK